MLREELDGRCRSDVENGRLEILISEVETAYSKFRTHIMLVEQQRFSHQQMRAELDSTTVMVTLDFGTFQSKNGKLPDLVLVIHFLSDSELCHIYLDCLPTVLAAESKDWCYVKSVLLELHKATCGCSGGATRIQIIFVL